MSDLRDLYQEVILDHGRRPRNLREIAHADRRARGYNPLCGDQVEVFVDLDDEGRIADVAFVGKGCAISQASTSMMTQALKGRTVEEARELFDAFHDMITAPSDPSPAVLERLGKLAVFAGVRDYPNRAKCATLGWHTLVAALEGREEPVSTE